MLKLETVDIMRPSGTDCGTDWAFVHMDHPVIDLLRYNKKAIGCDVDEYPRVDGQWLKVSNRVFKQCCNVLQDHMLLQMSHIDQPLPVECTQPLEEQIDEAKSECHHKTRLLVSKP